MKTAVEAGSRKRVPVKIADSFLLAYDVFMRRTGQGSQVTQSILALERPPDVPRLRGAAATLTRKHPLLAARIRRDWRTWLPFWDVPAAENLPPLPLGLWHEKGAVAAGAESVEIEDAGALLRQRLVEPLSTAQPAFHARLDVVVCRDQTSRAALTWAHLLIDGKGAELLLAEIGRLCEGVDVNCEGRAVERPVLDFQEKIRRTKGVMVRFDELAALGVHSLGGPQPRRGPAAYEVLTLDEETSATVRERAASLTGALFPLPYYLACATRAHAAVFASRGQTPRCYVSNVPIQMRKRGANGPLFHNQMTVLFFCLLQENAASLSMAASALKQQFAEMARERLDESFTTVLELMMRVPAGLFMRIVRWQFKGEINSFFHSHTGVFAPELTTFAGARITNAWHLPCLGAPPGTGIFFSERGGRITAVLTWREGCLSAPERELMLATLLEDLTGTPQPAPADAL